MSSELFESQEEEFVSVCDTIRKKIDDQIPKLVGEQRKRVVREAERSLDEATQMIHEMESEVRKAPAPYRNQMNAKVRNYRRDLDQLNNTLKKVNSGSRENQGFNRNDDFESVAASHRARLLTGNETLNRTSASIGRSQRVAAETDQIGTDIIDELGGQREQLVRTRDRLIETDAELSRSRKILKGMAKRVITNKLILIVIAILELAILVGVVYWKFFS